MQEKESRMSEIAKLAKDTVELYIKTKKVMSLPKDLSIELKQKRGVFVSIKKKGELRGCIGTLSPTQPNLALEIINNAISSATRDPRFPPVKEDELKDLTYSVDVLGDSELVKEKSELNPERYGVIVESGWKRGVLLPDLEGVDSVEEQLDIALRKAGIRSNEKYEIYRFEVKRYK